MIGRREADRATFFFFFLKIIIRVSYLKGTIRQYSGHMSQVFKTVKTIEIHPVRPTEVCGKVLSEKNG